MSKGLVDHTKKWVELWLAAVLLCHAPIGQLSPLPCLITSPSCWGTNFLYLSNPHLGTSFPFFHALAAQYCYCGHSPVLCRHVIFHYLLSTITSSFLGMAITNNIFTNEWEWTYASIQLISTSFTLRTHIEYLRILRRYVYVLNKICLASKQIFRRLIISLPITINNCGHYLHSSISLLFLWRCRCGIKNFHSFKVALSRYSNIQVNLH